MASFRFPALRCAAPLSTWGANAKRGSHSRKETFGEKPVQTHNQNHGGGLRRDSDGTGSKRGAGHADRRSTQEKRGPHAAVQLELPHRASGKRISQGHPHRPGELRARRSAPAHTPERSRIAHAARLLPSRHRGKQKEGNGKVS